MRGDFVHRDLTGSLTGDLMKSVPPLRIKVGEDVYEQTLLLMHSRRPSGAPALVTVLDANAQIDLQGEEEFLVAYVLLSDLKKE